MVSFASNNKMYIISKNQLVMIFAVSQIHLTRHCETSQRFVDSSNSDMPWPGLQEHEVQHPRHEAEGEVGGEEGEEPGRGVATVITMTI